TDSIQTKSDCFSTDATTILEEMTRGVALLAQVSNYDNNTGLPLVHLWNLIGDEVCLDSIHLGCLNGAFL
uniref:Uncharacterized protein n=1 Tax=Fundulus heteroclitus TaxID=8078 RepID=A0A3Q2NWD4_FUNHE